MTRGARPWDFGYEPIAPRPSREDGGPTDLVVATSAPVSTAAVEAALAPLLPGARAEVLLDRAPLFWARVRAERSAERGAIESALRAAGVPVRYVASARSSEERLAPRLATAGAPRARPDGWRARPASSPTEQQTEGRWFLRADDGGVGVDRLVCGTGAGARLAVVDDEVAEIDSLDLEGVQNVGVEQAPRAHCHGALMVAWAVGTSAAAAAGRFVGVAPDASVRLYAIPKPGEDVVSLPLAIARAVFDGADVVACATYVNGSWSPMLDDALEVAARLGRRGRGTAVVLPTSREASSPPGSVHSSWSLAFGDPPSDPRAFCVGPSGRGGGWFVWPDKKGRLRPFANRGPAVRWLAPGDDLAYPFARPERLYHAESSGASAIAAGVLLLVLATNPSLRLEELDAVVTASVTRVAPEHPADGRPLADPADMLPEVADADEHNAKHGYGLMNATRACLLAGDPVTAALVRMGEEAGALRYAAARRADPVVRAAYSRRFARWAARALLTDPVASHAARALLRHLRLTAAAGEVRRAAHGAGTVLRQLSLLLRRLPVRSRPSRRGAEELGELQEALEALSAAARADALARARLERRLHALAADAWVVTPTWASAAPFEAVGCASTPA